MTQFGTLFRHSLACLAGLSITLIFNGTVYGQSGLRESLERLDRDGDGEIEPEEITPLARPYLERITRASRMSIDRDNDIEDLQEAARKYHAQQNGAAEKDVHPEGESTVKPFGTDRNEPLVPEFGLADVKYAYTQDDLDFADRTMRSHDRNRDGYIDRAEAADEKWTHRNPFDDDVNEDDRLSRLELAQRYARRRLRERASGELRKKDWRTGGEVRPTTRDRKQRVDSNWWRTGGNSTWLTASVLGRFDSNKNGRLESQESQSLGMPTAQIDTDRDGDLSREELHAFLAELQEETGGLSEGIPGWFYELDANRDRQVSMPEFATEWTNEKIQEFDLLDMNGDGLLTSSEVVRSKSMVGGSYSNRTAEVLPPGRTIISEIEVSEDYLIGDLNVQLSITHTTAAYLDCYLTGPDGQRIELFTEVGGRDDNFDDTIFDDQSQHPITKARPPFRGTFMPEALLKRQPSLSHFNGKSVKGVWQLVIRGTRSERFGMLHSWSLLLKPQESMLGQPAVAAAEDGPQSPSSAWPVARQESPPSKSGDGRPESTSRSEPQRRPAIDYREIGRRMEDAVKAGKMTQDQVREAWIKIKSGSKGKDDSQKGGDRDKSRYEEMRSRSGLSREEAIERYKEQMRKR
jgi:subtilisin-like proprotein convertase family protein/Ca2+-binding EF-hand superfamily protein